MTLYINFAGDIISLFWISASSASKFMLAHTFSYLKNISYILNSCHHFIYKVSPWEWPDLTRATCQWSLLIALTVTSSFGPLPNFIFDIDRFHSTGQMLNLTTPVPAFLLHIRWHSLYVPGAPFDDSCISQLSSSNR